MRILLLNYEFPPVGGGGGYVSYNVAKRLVERGHSVTIVTATYRNLKAEEDVDGIQVYRVPSLRKRMERSTSFEMLTYLILTFLFLTILRLRGRRFDVAHIHFALPTGLLGPWVKFLFRVKYLLTIHGTDIPGNDETRFKMSHELSRPFLIFSLGNAAQISTVTPHLKELTQNVMNVENISVVPNGVNTQAFYPEEAEKENSLIFLGRLIPIKSPEFIITAFPYILRRVKDARLIIGGDGYLRGTLEKLTEREGMAEHISFVGWIPHDKLPEFYSRGKVFLSLQRHDNFGSLAMMEAMACGLPVIAADTGNTSMQVKNGVNGFLVRLNDRDEFVEKAVYLLTHEKERERMGREAARLIATDYSWDTVTDKYEKLLEEITKNNGK